MLFSAERIAFVTEDFSKYTNDTVGGLINASMGNITELVVSIFALKKGLLRVVQVCLKLSLTVLTLECLVRLSSD